MRDTDRDDNGNHRGSGQLIEHHHHYGDSGRGSESRLNTIVLGVAAASLSIIMAFFGWQQMRMIEKVDAMSIRLSVLETTVNIK